MSKVKVCETHDSLRIYIRGFLHVHLDRSGPIHMQSWIERGAKTFVIEYTTGGDTITCEYNSKKIFFSILKQLDGLL